MNNADIIFHECVIPYFSIVNTPFSESIKMIFTTNVKDDWKFGNGAWQKNYSELSSILKILPEDCCTTFQTHTNNVRIVKNENRGEGIIQPTLIKDYDGIITNEKNLLLCSFEADCVPVYFYDKSKKAIAMVHSGWRGTCDLISKNAVSKMVSQFDCNPKDIMVVIGPCACKNCYEVGEELIEKFSFNFKDEINKIFTPCKENKFTLDLPLAIQITLEKTGILLKNIYSVNKCTIESLDLCSFRRTKSTTSHMLTAIMIS